MAKKIFRVALAVGIFTLIFTVSMGVIENIVSPTKTFLLVVSFAWLLTSLIIKGLEEAEKGDMN